jgi:hypothetical protein
VVDVRSPCGPWNVVSTTYVHMRLVSATFVQTKRGFMQTAVVSATLVQRTCGEVHRSGLGKGPAADLGGPPEWPHEGSTGVASRGPPEWLREGSTGVPSRGV